MDAAREAIEFLGARSVEQLASDRMLLLGLVKELEIIGEAANQIPRDVQTTIPGIPWPQIIGMRNRLIHAYATIAPQIVWSTVVNDLHELVAAVEPLLLTEPAD